MLKNLYIFLFTFSSFGLLSIEAELPVIDYQSIHHPEISTTGMVVSQRMIASQVGADILSQGGNAVDASIAASIVLGSCIPGCR